MKKINNVLSTLIIGFYLGGIAEPNQGSVMFFPFIILTLACIAWVVTFVITLIEEL